MKRLWLAIVFIALFAIPSFAITPSISNKHTYDNAYRWTGKPKDLLLDWAQAIEDAIDGTTGVNFLYCVPDATADQASEGTIYYDSDTDNLYYRNASGWVTIAASTSSTLAEAYAAGSGITVDTAAITLTSTTAADNVILALVHDETGNYSAMTITNASAYPAIQITGTSTGDDITGTSALWTVSEAGVGTFAGIIVGATDIVLENGDKIDNGTNDTILFTTGDEDLKLDFTTGADLITLSSSTGVTTIDFAALTSIIGLTTITGDAADMTISITADAAGEDLIISQAGSVDGSVQILSAGTGADAIDIETTAGGISVASAGATMNVLLDATAGAVYLDSGEASADDAIVIVTTGAGSGMQITSLADIDITTTGAAGEDITIDNVGGSVIVQSSESAVDSILLNSTIGGIQIYAAGGASTEDIDIAATSSSVKITAGESAVDSIVISSTVGGIDITAAGGAATEDIDVTATSSSINLTAGESATDSIVISSTVGGIDITAAGGVATEDIDILATSSSVNIDAGENSAAAITITTGAGATGGTSETIVVTNTDGTGTGAITLASAAGGITATALDDISLALTSSTAGEDILLTTTGAFDNSITITSSGTLDDAIGLVTSAGGINISMSGGAAGEDFEITTATSIDFSSSEAAADQFKMDATGVIAGNAINLETTDGGIIFTADGAVNGDITIDSEDDILITSASDITLTATGNLSFTVPVIGDGADDIVGFRRDFLAGTDAVALTTAMSGKVFTNAGDADGNIYTLPEGSTAIGCYYTFVVAAATAVNINPNDGTDRFIAPIVDAAGDSIQSSTVGDSVTVLCIDATNWVILAAYPAATDWPDSN